MASILAITAESVLIGAGILAGEEVTRLILKRAAKMAGAGPTVVRDIGVVLRLVAAVAIASTALRLTGLASEFTALTISGIGALAVTLALQATLSNVISGVLLFNDGVIRLNDVVEYSSVKGKVVRVALRNTWIKMDSGMIAIVSNSSLSNGPLVNHSATERLSRKYAIE